MSNSFVIMDCKPPGSYVHGILQATILEWVAISYSKGIFLTQGSNPSLMFPGLAGGFFTTSATWETRDLKGCFMEGIRLILRFAPGPVGRSPRVEEFGSREGRIPNQ